MDRVYAAIDLKSFYASVECAARMLDPLRTNLVVADESRTEKTICLAVSPSLKALGIPGRARLFEVVEKVRQVNAIRKGRLQGADFEGESWDAQELASNPKLAVSYIVAPPRMRYYVEASTKIYGIYLQYIAPEDIHVYSIDEVFMDLTAYLKLYGQTPRELVMTMIRNVLQRTGITATAGIGSNLYLCKVAMDIVAKHIPPDEDGVRIAELTERSYREQLWDHRPLTDFWRVGPGYARKLEKHRLFTMGDIARCSLGGAQDYYNEELLYRLFGVNAELLIDHAWGIEPCTMRDIKAYRPRSNSVSSGQVLQRPYTYDEGSLIVREMADQLALDLARKGMVTDQVVLMVGYDREAAEDYRGELVIDRYGRTVPKYANGSEPLNGFTASSRRITRAVMEIYGRTVDKNLLIRRVTISANHLIPAQEAREEGPVQLNLFDTPREEPEDEERQMRKQQTILAIQKKFGRNAVIKGMNLREEGTTISRNGQIGGHKA